MSPYDHGRAAEIEPPAWGATPVTIGQVCMSDMRAAGAWRYSLKLK